MGLKAQRAAALKAAQTIIAKAKAEERDLTDTEVTEVEAKHTEVEELDAKIERAEKSSALVDRIGALGTDDGEDEEEPGARAKSIGEHFVKTAGAKLKNLPGTRASISAPEFIKAAGDPQGTGGPDGPFADWLTDIDRSIQPAKRDRPVVADLLGSGSISGSAIRYYIEGELEGDFATVPEGGQKPQMHLGDPTPEVDFLSKIAAFIVLHDETVEDMPFWVSEINNRLLYRLAMVEEAQLLNGDGQGSNLTGILNRSGVQTEASAADGDNADALFRAMTKVSTATDYTADGVVIHPLDYQAFRLSKDGNGQYFAGGYFTGPYGNGGVLEQPPLWGLRTVVSRAVTQGTALVGNFNQAATVYRKGGVRIESTNSADDDFTHNRIKTRAEERLALAVRQPAGFVKVTLAGAPVEG